MFLLIVLKNAGSISSTIIIMCKGSHVSANVRTNITSILTPCKYIDDNLKLLAWILNVKLANKQNDTFKTNKKVDI
jgi:hypothetical protein